MWDWISPEHNINDTKHCVSAYLPLYFCLLYLLLCICINSRQGQQHFHIFIGATFPSFPWMYAMYLLSIPLSFIIICCLIKLTSLHHLLCFACPNHFCFHSHRLQLFLFVNILWPGHLNRLLYRSWPSVCPSDCMCCTGFKLKQKVIVKQKLVWTFQRAGVTGVPIFRLKL